MTIKAFVLVEAAVGRARDVATALKGLDGVESADVTTGPWDIIVIINGPDANAVGKVIPWKISQIEGVVRIVICIAVSNGKVLQRDSAFVKR